MEKISYEEYQKLCQKLNQNHFMHTLSWAKFRESMGWNYEIIGYFKNGELVAGALCQFKKLPKLKYNMMYISKGIVIDYNDVELLKEVTEKLKEYAKKHKSYVIKIDPEIKRYKIDYEKNPLEEQTKVYDNLLEAGYIHQGFTQGFEGFNPRHTFILNYENKSIEELFSQMKPADKNKIKRSRLNGVEIKKGSKKNLDEFMELMEITGNRGGYQVRSREYFELLFDNFQEDEIELLFSYLNIEKYIEILKEKLEKLEKEEAEYNKILLQEGLSEKKIKKTNNLLNEVLRNKNKADEELIEAEKLLQKHPDGVNLSAAIYVYNNERVWYWYGGSNDVFRNLRPVNDLMWTCIENSHKKGYKEFDFLGTSGILDPKDKNYGLYKFKKSFAGEFIEYLGEFDLVINPLINKSANHIIKQLKTSNNSKNLKILQKLIK